MFKLQNLFLAACFLTITYFSKAQCVIPSSNGYQVHVTIVPKSVMVSSSSCPWGYNYNLTYDYAVTFTGNNIPSALYTLQTIIYCGGQANGGYTMPLTGGNGTSTTTTNPAIGTTGSANAYGSNPDCLHATVQTLHCNIITLIIAGPGIPYQTVACSYTGSVLPVELIDYKGAATDNGVQLGWSTASESRNEYFTVYKSTDGQEWKQAAKITGAGTSEEYNEYAWTDEAAMTGINYYKLTQTDLDGVTTDLGIADIGYVAANTSGTMVYPNPSTTGEFNVRVLSRTESPVTVIFRDQLGRIAGEKTLSETGSLGAEYVLQDAVRPQGASAFYIVEIMQNDQLIGRHKVEVLGVN